MGRQSKPPLGPVGAESGGGVKDIINAPGHLKFLLQDWGTAQKRLRKVKVASRVTNEEHDPPHPQVRRLLLCPRHLRCPPPPAPSLCKVPLLPLQVRAAGEEADRAVKTPRFPNWASRGWGEPWQSPGDTRAPTPGQSQREPGMHSSCTARCSPEVNLGQKDQVGL